MALDAWFWIFLRSFMPSDPTTTLELSRWRSFCKPGSENRWPYPKTLLLGFPSIHSSGLSLSRLAERKPQDYRPPEKQQHSSVHFQPATTAKSWFHGPDRTQQIQITYWLFNTNHSPASKSHSLRFQGRQPNNQPSQLMYRPWPMVHHKPKM